ncbi:MAG: acyl-ACP thioesterase [Treponema sp.]|jgi:acyl-ACP thioesterase|nr:acyl-ACP thioesterase [Treponema sp.]
MDIWQQSFSVAFKDIDPSDRITLGAVFEYFQEAAINHAEQLGVGRESMAQSGQVWILSRMSVLIERRPRYGERLSLRSWPRGEEKLFALRDYDIRDASDTPLVRGRSGWLIVDRERRRPLRPGDLVERLPLNQGLDALPRAMAALGAQDGLSRVGERRAVYSDIDYNRHVNNTRYIQWIQDSTEASLLEQAASMEFHINYLSEMKGGERTEVWSAPLPGAASGFAFEGRRSDGGQLVFRAQLLLDPR